MLIAATVLWTWVPFERLVTVIYVLDLMNVQLICQKEKKFSPITIESVFGGSGESVCE